MSAHAPPRRLAVALALPLAAALAAGCAHRSGDPALRVRHALAERLAAQNDWPAAFRAADALVQEDPEDDAARLLRARALRHAGAVAEAEADVRLLLDRDARNGAAHGEAGLLAEAAGRHEEALRHHREARRLAPADPRAANNLGFALLTRGRDAEAVAVLEEALRRWPADARLRNNLGFALAGTGDFTRASRQFALAGSPAQARHNLGVAYERAKNLPQAYDLYLEAARLDGAGRLPRANLAHVAQALGRPVPELATPPAGTPEVP